MTRLIREAERKLFLDSLAELQHEPLTPAEERSLRAVFDWQQATAATGDRSHCLGDSHPA